MATTDGASANDARTRTIRLQDGTIAELRPGPNVLHDRTVWWNADGSTSFSMHSAGPRDENAMVGGNQAGTLGSPRQMRRFGAGNQAAATHGARSPARVNPVAAELVEETLAAAPFLSQASFRPALEAWARAEARCLLLEAWLDEHGLLDDNGEPRPATALMTQQENLALKHRTRLGLDAASRAGIEASLTSSAVGLAGLEAALDRGAELLRQRMAGGVAGQQAPQVVTGETWGSPAAPEGERQPLPARGAQAEAGGRP